MGWGPQNSSHETILRESLLKTLRKCDKLHAVENIFPSKEGSGDEDGSLETDVVTSPGYLLSEYPCFEECALMLDVTIAYSCAPSALDAPINVACCAVVKTVSQKHHSHRGRNYNMFKFVLHVFATCEKYSVRVDRVLEDQ